MQLEAHSEYFTTEHMQLLLLVSFPRRRNCNIASFYAGMVWTHHKDGKVCEVVAFTRDETSLVIHPTHSTTLSTPISPASYKGNMTKVQGNFP